MSRIKMLTYENDAMHWHIHYSLYSGDLIKTYFFPNLPLLCLFSIKTQLQTFWDIIVFIFKLLKTLVQLFIFIFYSLLLLLLDI